MTTSLPLVDAGAATADLTPDGPVRRGGYGNRAEPATGVLDPLLARVLTLTRDGRTVAMVVCDLLGVSRRLVEPARALVAERHGIPADHVLVAATHTHAGPEGLFTDADRPYLERGAEAIAGAVGDALATRRPVGLKLAIRHLDSIGRNRRDHDGPLVRDLAVLLAAPPEAEPPVATVTAYACHATVLESDNLRISADFPGAANRFVEQALGGTSIYLQGACGDVNPVWMRHDAAEVARLGGIVGATTVRAAHELRPVGEHQQVVNLSWSEDLDAAPAEGRVLEVDLAATQRIVELPRRVLGSADDLRAEAADLRAALAGADRDERRHLRPRLNRVEMELVYQPYAPTEPGRTHKAEVQVLRLSPDVAVVGLPGEFFVEIGTEIAARAPFDHVLVAGYANNYLGYFPTAGEFDRHGYEVGCARFDPEAAELFVEAALDALHELSRG